MGAIVSRFRKKKSTIEVLESLEEEIKRLQQFKRKNQERQKKFIAKLLLYSILFYIAVALIFYFLYFPDAWRDRLIYSIPLLLFPLLIWIIKKVLHWYFVKRIAGNDLDLEELRERKKQMLEEVMEKETYKKAKEILEKFDPERFKEMEKPKTSPVQGTPGTEVRQRMMGQRSPPGSQLRPGMTPRPPGMTPGMRPQQGPQPPPGTTPYGPRSAVGMGIRPRNIMESGAFNAGTPQGPPLPRPILPRERGTMDRVLEYLVGDGPQNRYALICRNCCSHNGMALKEEFEYIAFRCCYCFTINPAHKKRPFAPRIEPPPVEKKASEGQGEDEGDEDSEEERTQDGSEEEETEELGTEEAMDVVEEAAITDDDDSGGGEVEVLGELEGGVADS